MNPADRLIVALDVPPKEGFPLIRKIGDKAGAYKLSVGTFLSPSQLGNGLDLAGYVLDFGKKLMLDLKLYDTRDTVKRTMEIAAKLGATWVTVHADCAEHAVGFGPEVLAVRRLTDGTGGESKQELAMVSDGFICSVNHAKFYRGYTDKLLVCPGIRPAGTVGDNHLRPATPREAVEAGADYIVVGRPIYAAADPVAAARAIIDEIEAAGAQQPG